MKKSESITFGFYLHKYLTIYLPGQRGLSTNTIMSYRDTFSLLIDFIKTEKQMKPENLSLSFLTRDLVIEFLQWIENKRKCSLSTRNQRYGVICSFCKWLASENPEYLKLSEEVSSIKLKKAPKPEMNYLSSEAMICLLQQPDTSTNDGLRDLTILAFTYDTGARVSEVVNLRIRDIRFDSPPIVKITGKGNKTRIVPLLPQTLGYIKEYMKRRGLSPEKTQDAYLFVNRNGDQISRFGVKYILDKYVKAGKETEPLLFPDKITPHTLRHSKAMHLLQAGNNIVHIRDLLGHADLSTTERYARADPIMKKEALEKAALKMPITSEPNPGSDLATISSGVERDMAQWLKQFRQK